MPSVATSAYETYRPDLAGSLMQFDLQADQAGFVGLRLAPVIEVRSVGGQYGVIPVEELVKDRDTLRANDGSYNRGQGKTKKQTYHCEDHGFEERVDEREATMFAEWWDSELLAAERCRDAVLRNHEQRVMDLVGNVANETAAANGAWTVTATSTPVSDVHTAMLALRGRTGNQRASLCVEWEIFRSLRQNAQILDNIKYWGGDDPKLDNISAAMVAEALGVDEVIIAGGMKNTAAEGVGGKAATLASMWDRTKALLFVSSESRNMQAPRWANTFHWGADGSMIGSTMESYYDASRRSDIIRSRMDTDEQIVYAAAAEVITGVAT